MDEEPSNDLCVDASLWVRLLAQEELSEEADKIFSLWMEEFDFFIAPSFLVFEVTSALRKKFKRGQLDANFLEQTLERFFAFPIILYQSQEFFGHVWEWSQRLNETVLYDVSYLALAAWKKVPYYTADGKFFEKAKGFYPDAYLV